MQLQKNFVGMVNHSVDPILMVIFGRDQFDRNRAAPEHSPNPSTATVNTTVGRQTGRRPTGDESLEVSMECRASHNIG